MHKAGRQPAPAVIEVDLLGEGSAAHLDPVQPVLSGTAYLQYSSGSTRQPTGVVIRNKNVIVNVEQCASDYIGNEVPPETVFVSWLPFYHDMGWVVGVCAPLVLERSAVLMSPLSFLRPGPLDATACHQLPFFLCRSQFRS